MPTALLDFGVRTSVGVYAFYDDFLVKDNALRVHAAFGGTDWLRLTVADLIPIGKNATLKIRGEASRRPDFFFYGIGPTSRLVDRARYGADWIDGSATFHATLPHGVTVNAFTGVRTTRFYDQPCCNYLSVRDIAANPGYPLPAAYDTGYTGFRTGGDIAFDTRRPRPEPGSGVRVEASGSFGTDTARPRGDELGQVRRHRPRLRRRHRAQPRTQPLGHRALRGSPSRPADPVRRARRPRRRPPHGRLPRRPPLRPERRRGHARIPLPDLGLPRRRGAARPRQRLRQAPRRAHPENLRLSFDFGVRAAGKRDHAFSVLVGAGTETFGQGARLNEARLLFGATTGF